MNSHSKIAAHPKSAGFIEIRPAYGISPETEMSGVFARLQREDLPLGMARVTNREDVWNALRQFFQDQQTTHRGVVQVDRHELQESAEAPGRSRAHSGRRSASSSCSGCSS